MRDLPSIDPALDIINLLCQTKPYDFKTISTRQGSWLWSGAVHRPLGVHDAVFHHHRVLVNWGDEVGKTVYPRHFLTQIFLWFVVGDGEVDKSISHLVDAHVIGHQIAPGHHLGEGAGVFQDKLCVYDPIACIHRAFPVADNAKRSFVLLTNILLTNILLTNVLLTHIGILCIGIGNIRVHHIGLILIILITTLDLVVLVPVVRPENVAYHLAGHAGK